MTCVAGVVGKDGRVWLMSDSAASNNGGLWLMRDSKVWTHGELALGMAGSFRGRDILQSKMSLPEVPPGINAEHWLRTVFVDEVRKLFKDNGFETSTSHGQQTTQTYLLVGLRARLFIMRDDFGLGEEILDWTAIGSGAAEAAGSLFTSSRFIEDPLERLTEALKAATLYNPGTVQPPYRHVATP